MTGHQHQRNTFRDRERLVNQNYLAQNLHPHHGKKVVAISEVAMTDLTKDFAFVGCSYASLTKAPSTFVPPPLSLMFQEWPGFSFLLHLLFFLVVFRCCLIRHISWCTIFKSLRSSSLPGNSRIFSVFSPFKLA